jgi:predicted permease
MKATTAIKMKENDGAGGLGCHPAPYRNLPLIAQPLVTWIIAGPLLGLPQPTVQAAVLLAALPTGTGSFMLAEFYEREALLTRQVVLFSTVLSLISLSLLMMVWT